MIKFDFDTYTNKYLDNENYDDRINNIMQNFLSNGKMKGWYDLDISRNELLDIENTANYVRKEADTFIVIGVGGSYLGSKAIIDALSPYFNKNIEILFAGYNLSSTYLSELLEHIKNKRIIVNVISKSGNTIEPNIAFNEIYQYMKTIYNEEELKNRIIITTDKEKGRMLEFANKIGCKKFIIPDNIGGRYSVLTPVGLLPIAVSGIDINKILAGARSAKNNLSDAYKYAEIRDKFYQKGRFIEAFVTYEEKLSFFNEWLKQLFAETQGKDGKAILPISLVNTRDLHSLGQYIQDGKELIFETNLHIINKSKLYIGEYHKNLNEIENEALYSVCTSHYNGHTPSIVITMDELNEYNLGYLIFFFFTSSMVGSYLLDVNYYDQPGVNGYKDILNERLK